MKKIILLLVFVFSFQLNTKENFKNKEVILYCSGFATSYYPTVDSLIKDTDVLNYTGNYVIKSRNKEIFNFLEDYMLKNKREINIKGFNDFKIALLYHHDSITDTIGFNKLNSINVNQKNYEFDLQFYLLIIQRLPYCVSENFYLSAYIFLNR